MQNILVTGGFGFIGSNLIKELKRRYPSANIDIIDKLNYASNTNNVNRSDYRHFFNGDLSTMNFKGIFDVIRYDTVFHLAAESHVDKSISDPGLFFQSNVIGTQRLLENIRQNNQIVTFINVSTDEVYGDLDYGEIEEKFQEDWLLNPHSPYAASKASQDMIALSYYHTYGMDVIVTRCSNNYGPRQDKTKLIPKIIKTLRPDCEVAFTLYNEGKNERDWLFVYDHVDGLIKAATLGTPGEIYNFGTGSSVPNAQIIGILEDITYISLFTESVTDRLGHDRVYKVDYSKALKDLGWKPSVDLETGLRKTVSWYKKNEWIFNDQKP